MAKELLLRLGNQIEWKSLYKSAIAGALLLYVLSSGFSPWACVVFFAGSFALHVSEGEGRSLVRDSLIVLSVPALLILRLVSGEVASAWPEYIVILIYALAIWFAMSLSRFHFKNNAAAYGAFNASVLFFLSLSIIALRSAPAFAGQSGLLNILSYPVLFFAFAAGIYMLVSEYFSFIRIRIAGRRLMAINMAFALIAAEMLWITGFLPLGAISSAALMTVFLVLARDVQISNILGKLDTRLILRATTIFAVSLLLLFAASPWEI